MFLGLGVLFQDLLLEVDLYWRQLDYHMQGY